MPSPQHIRPIAICVLRRGDSILVFEGYDRVKDQIYYRPLGGGIEYGERGRDTIVREMHEEIGADLVNLQFLATLENIFVLDGQTGHEIVLVYEAELADAAVYDRGQFVGVEDTGESFVAMWKPLSDFAAGRCPLFPHGLLELITP